MNKLKVKLDPGAYVPERAHEADAGYDLRSPVDIWVGDYAVIDTGVHVAIPEGYVGMLKSKSGLNVRYHLTGEGVIDSGYTGSIRVKLYNHGDNMYHIVKGDKVIQLVLLPIYTPDIELVEHLEDTSRGNNGFGSTGK